ncbi:hypothetical protein AWB75_04409 [Caballeronia catudaia]|uniref:Uncharacterized protein n=1 Tax=Caballeronia catudaia TaxID=1777136 RepID=A0A158C2U3_9BURK|nr:hypothetical protein AWB75_04409 [Caballeronia catudaia]
MMRGGSPMKSKPSGGPYLIEFGQQAPFAQVGCQTLRRRLLRGSLDFDANLRLEALKRNKSSCHVPNIKPGKINDFLSATFSDPLPMA